MGIGIRIGLTGRPVGGGLAAQVAALFDVPGSLGVFLDPSDLSTLFTDTARTTPLSAPAQSAAAFNGFGGKGTGGDQATALARPTLGRHPVGGRRNLLTWTEDQTQAVWRNVNASAVMQGDGSVIVTENTASGGHYTGQNAAGGGAVTLVSGTQYTFSVEARISSGTRNARFSSENAGIIDLVAVFDLVNGTVVSGAGASIAPTSDGYYRISVTRTALSSGSVAVNPFQMASGTSASYLGDGVSAIQYRRPQFELGATATAYQRVTTAFDVTEAGVQDCWYLGFDGGDALVTPSINWGTDEMTVVAGLTRPASATGIVAEFSASVTANNGSFYVAVNDTSRNWTVLSRGDAIAALTQLGQSDNVSLGPAVIASRSDISGDITDFRFNGVTATSGTGDKGTGNFGNYPLFIGARAGTSIFLTGNIYMLFIINRWLTDTERGLVEQLAAQRSGVTL
jgi:hypothetical protein